MMEERRAAVMARPVATKTSASQHTPKQGYPPDDTTGHGGTWMRCMGVGWAPTSKGVGRKLKSTSRPIFHHAPYPSNKKQVI